jgi:hypothetical protein
VLQDHSILFILVEVSNGISTGHNIKKYILVSLYESGAIHLVYGNKIYMVLHGIVLKRSIVDFYQLAICVVCSFSHVRNYQTPLSKTTCPGRCCKWMLYGSQPTLKEPKRKWDHDLEEEIIRSAAQLPPDVWPRISQRKFKPVGYQI